MRSLAKDLGLTYSRVRDLLNQENGTPTLEEFLRICEHYDVEPTDMLNKILEIDDGRSESEPSAKPESSASSDSDVSSVSSNNLDDDYVSHVADMIAADPSQFALMAHTDPNKFLESSTPRD